MKYYLTTLFGCQILDEKLQIIETIPLSDWSKREQAEEKARKKASPLPPEKIPEALALFKNKKYFRDFYQKNLELTKKAIKNAIAEDQLIIQASANMNELDKVANLLSKRLQEWYSLYFPELLEKINSPEGYAKLVTGKTKAQSLQELGLTETMGADLDKIHVDEILRLAEQITQLYHLRRHHEEYLQRVMLKYCPNLLELAGVSIGAGLIELGRSLKRLALLPASTIQLLGAEKALFRHITTGARSPKHGIIFAHLLVQKAKNKGRVARILADKLSLCARLDYFKGEFKAKEYRKELEGKLK
ncbi:hypothetical protein HYX14_05155 [Candidatus Woesearchaeota archaeon]|nr:hypothetical protein [Candidatus Woesearchaeota archaeon]